MSSFNVKITWLGHATFLLELPNGKTLLVDPWLAGNPECPEAFHEVKADAILVTHGHFDHVGNLFDAAARSTGPLIANFEIASWAGKKGVAEDRLVGLNKGGSVRLKELGITVSLTHAQHSSSFDEEDGTRVYLGEACGFVIDVDDAEIIYIAGDTNLFSDMTLIGDLYEPDIAILPIGDHFTMDPRQAAMAAEFTGVNYVIPAHYDTFPLLTGTPQQLRNELEARGLSAQVKSPKPGEVA